MQTQAVNVVATSRPSCSRKDRWYCTSFFHYVYVIIQTHTASFECGVLYRITLVFSICDLFDVLSSSLNADNILCKLYLLFQLSFLRTTRPSPKTALPSHDLVRHCIASRSMLWYF
jgi:hypothetical protein